MGKTVKNLSSKELPQQSIFNSRSVVEVCESIHWHYRNLRVNLSPLDFETLASGIADALRRWEKRGKPMDGKTHIELCRKQIAQFPKHEGIKINLNENLYPKFEGRIFSEGSEFTEPEYIHLKIRDLRLEMPIEEFKTLAEAVKEADEKLRSLNPMLQKT